MFIGRELTYESSGTADFTSANVWVDSVTTPTPTGNISSGDVDGNGTIDIIDALLTAQYSVGITVPSTFIAANADVDKDGSINVIDALMIAQYSVGIITGF